VKRDGDSWMKIEITTKDWLIIRFVFLIIMALIMFADYYVDVLNWGTVWLGILWGFQTATLIVDYGQYKYPTEPKKDTTHNV